jgi:GNAT superfamily N-acetyltransferase
VPPPTDLAIRPLTADLWPAFADLLDQGGPAGRCWCMAPRIGAEYRRRPAAGNRDDFRGIVRQGPPPGLLALRGATAVGWCQVAPREVLPALDRAWRTRRVDDVPVWIIACFYVRKGHRRQGVTSALIAAAVDLARSAGAPAIEAFPLDGDVSPSATGTGYASTFAAAGFAEVARRSPERPIMRLTFPAGPPRSGRP